MPKVFVYNWRDFDEAPLFERYCREFGFELDHTEQSPSLENLNLLKGAEYVSVITTPLRADILDAMSDLGVKMISTRTIGYNHIDIDHAREIGMAISHITYDPTGVAEYTVMMMLMALRKVTDIMDRGNKNDFSLKGLLGKELKSCTVGIIGSGNIGLNVLRILSGFGCDLLYTNRRENPEASKIARYVSMEELLNSSDIVSVHLELNEDTRHIIDSSVFSRMKNGAIFVNTARGPLVDSKALVKAVRSGEIGMAAIDVIENEFDMCYYDRSSGYSNDELEMIRSTPNIIHTHHMAFYYEDAVRDMVYNCIHGMKLFSEGKEDPYRLV